MNQKLIYLMISFLSMNIAMADQGQHVEGIGQHKGWGRQFKDAQICATLDAQIKCQKKEVVRVSDWSLRANCHEGYCNREAFALFECMNDDAILLTCSADEN